MIRVIRGELLKLRTTRLQLWLALLILSLLALLVSLTAASKSSSELARVGDQRSLVSLASVGILIAMILGLVSMAGEYTHGTVNHTFLATPVRERVIGAKLITGAVAGVAVAVFSLIASYVLTALWVSGSSAPFHLFSHSVLVRDAGILLGSALAASLGVGFGAVLRRQTAGIVIALVWLLVGEPVLSTAGVQEYSPGHAIASVVEVGTHDPEVLRFGAGLPLALAYVLVFAVAGTLVVKRTDVS